MPDIKKYKKLDKPDLTIFLTTKTAITHPSKNKNIKSRIKSSFKKIKIDRRRDKMVDFHLDIVKKIDAIIAENEKEKETEFKEPEVPQKHLEMALNRIIERRTLGRKTETPSFKPDIKSTDTTGVEDEFVEVETTIRNHPDFRFITSLEEPKDILFIEGTKIEDGDFASKMLGDRDLANKKMTMKFGFGKTKNKNEKTKQKNVGCSSKPVKKSSSKKIESKVEEKKPVKQNNYTKAERAMENYKKLIEEKEKELELAKKIAKEKQEELEKKAKEKIKKDRERKKLEKIEAKRLEEEARRREKELIKKKKAEELMKKIELKKGQREAKIKERELREKARMMEKKKLEAERVLKEEKIKKKLAEKKKIEAKKEVKTVKTPKTKKVKTKKKEEKPQKTEKRHIFGRKEPEAEKPVLTEDEDLIKVLTIVDDLLEKLPDKAIDEFVQSDDFELYEKVVSKYKVK